MTAGLDHPGVVVVFDAGVTADLPWYTMRLVDGHTSLRDAFPHLGVDGRLGVLAEVAEAITFYDDQSICACAGFPAAESPDHRDDRG